MENNKIVFINIAKVVTFIAPDGQVATSRVDYDDINDYEYVWTPDGQTWLLNEVQVLESIFVSQTEIVDEPILDDLDDDDVIVCLQG